VVGLLNVRGFIHAWRAQKYDGVIAVISFLATLGFAPHLDRGIMIGVALSLGHYLFRNIKPDIALLSKYIDGTFRNSDRRGLKRCKYIAVVRYNNSLFFANVNYLEEIVLEVVASMPDLKHIVIVCNGMNEIDSSGEEMLLQIVARVRDAGYQISFTGMNEEVLDVLRRTHLFEMIGEDNIFGNVANALDVIWKKIHLDATEPVCPLRVVCFKDEALKGISESSFSMTLEG
jgi:anti-anti-sigma factor